MFFLLCEIFSRFLSSRFRLTHFCEETCLTHFCEESCLTHFCEETLLTHFCEEMFFVSRQPNFRYTTMLQMKTIGKWIAASKNNRKMHAHTAKLGKPQNPRLPWVPVFSLQFLKIKSCFCVVRKFFTVFVEPISFDTLLRRKLFDTLLRICAFVIFPN